MGRSVLQIRLSQEQKAVWEKWAESQGMGLSAFVRQVVDGFCQSPVPEKLKRRTPRTPEGKVDVQALVDETMETLGFGPPKPLSALLDHGTYTKADLCPKCQRKGLSCDACRAKFKGRRRVDA